MTNKKLPPLLRNQYKVENCETLSSLLLSPRSPKKDNNYMSCETCYNNVRREKYKRPPRFAISNVWTIGYIPHDVVGEIDNMLAVMVNKIRLFSYIFSYSGGAHKSIQGHHTFLKNDPEKIGSTMNHLQTHCQLNDVFAMACGRFTPTQRQIARDYQLQSTSIA